MDENAKRCSLLINGSIDLDQVLTVNCNEKKKVARKRWAILARALKSPSGSEPSSPTDECSVRRISSFMLLTTSRLDNLLQLHQDKPYYDLLKKRTWYKYSMRIDETELYVVIGHRKRTFSAEDLMGFNNTGNICIWPSEETLSYYIGTNLEIFKGKSILELGGGMSCLAGLFCAKYTEAKFVVLTDGNKISIENVEVSMFCNDFKCPVRSHVLKWGTNSLDEKFDIILCADCLFFDEARSDLIETFCQLLGNDGLGLVMAPRRANTLQKFIEKSRDKGFKCHEVTHYSDIVWQKHLNLLENNEYDENIHYPMLIELTKKSVEFHEKGRRHQDNVAKKLKYITKKSKREEKESLRTDAIIKQMESAALEAYRKDVENNADLSSIVIKKKIEENSLTLGANPYAGTKKPWTEVKSSEGKSYYYNSTTKETVWKKPKEGFVSITEQMDDVTKHQLKLVNKQRILDARLQMEEQKKEEAEARAAEFREKMKERRVESEPESTVSYPILTPANTNPYGQWQKVETTTTLIDLQLPKQEFEYYEVPAVQEYEPPSKEFKEKTVESLGEGKATFKKRKFTSTAKKNSRQRTDND